MVPFAFPTPRSEEQRPFYRNGVRVVPADLWVAIFPRPRTTPSVKGPIKMSFNGVAARTISAPAFIAAPGRGPLPVFLPPLRLKIVRIVEMKNNEGVVNNWYCTF
jgi:hypothetical protein